MPSLLVVALRCTATCLQIPSQPSHSSLLASICICPTSPLSHQPYIRRFCDNSIFLAQNLSFVTCGKLLLSVLAQIPRRTPDIVIPPGAKYSCGPTLLTFFTSPPTSHITSACSTTRCWIPPDQCPCPPPTAFSRLAACDSVHSEPTYLTPRRCSHWSESPPRIHPLDRVSSRNNQASSPPGHFAALRRRNNHRRIVAPEPEPAQRRHSICSPSAILLPPLLSSLRSPSTPAGGKAAAFPVDATDPHRPTSTSTAASAVAAALHPVFTIIHDTRHLSQPSMPTPSSNPPPDPHSPRSHSFSTCPEDSNSRSPQRSWRPPTGPDANDGPAAMDPHHDRDRMDEDASPAPVSAPMSPTEGISTEVILDDEPTSAVSSSRSTTMSPRPQSGDTAHSSPAADMESFKQGESDEEGHSAGDRLRASRADGSRRHDTRQSATTLHDDGKGMDIDADDVWEEELMAPSMGSEYSNMRVCSPPSMTDSMHRFADCHR